MSPSRSVVTMVGTYPPTACGLATYTHNLSNAIAAPGSGWRSQVVRVLDCFEVDTSNEVAAEWIGGDETSLENAIEVAERSDVVVLQHEFGLFAGPDGEDVLNFIHAVHRPLVVVLHTVLEQPTDHQRLILEEVMRVASAVVVQSGVALDRLCAHYSFDRARLRVIPHGAAPNFAGPSTIHRIPTILTWGLIGPGKGIEYAIDAVALLSHRHPAAHYVIAGETHPKVREHFGERYRNALIARAHALGVAKRVHFLNQHFDWETLRALVRSADVVILPYDSHEQVTSGVLVEAVASAKPVVATDFPHARELLTHGGGLVVDQGDAPAMALALGRILYEPGLAASMAAAARRQASELLWPEVGAKYRSLLDDVVSRSGVGVGG